MRISDWSSDVCSSDLLSQMIGDYDRRTTSTSVGRGSRSTSHGIQRERTLDIADLGALPRGRAVVFASGAPATLVETVPWMNGPHAAALRASIAAHDRSEEHTSELQSLMRTSYAVFCLKKKKTNTRG